MLAGIKRLNSPNLKCTPCSVLTAVVDKTAEITPSQGQWQVYYLGFARDGWTAASHAFALSFPLCTEAARDLPARHHHVQLRKNNGAVILWAMNIFLRSAEFDAWLAALKDKVGRARILHRIRSAEHGNFGDCEPVGEGVSEMRIHAGPGYRVYYTRRGEVIYLLLLAGDKSSQKRDIKRALEMARTLHEE